MTRPYVLRARAEAAERTRRDILEAARSGLLAAERLDFNVAEIAAGAGVARSTIYAAFESRAGLLAALASDTLERAGLPEVIAEYRRTDALQAMEGSLRANCRMYAADHHLLARLSVLAKADAEIAEPVTRLERDRTAGMADLAQRLAGQGVLRSGLGVDHAAHVLSVLTSFWTFDELYGGRGLSADACGDLLVEMAQVTLLGALPNEREPAAAPGAG